MRRNLLSPTRRGHGALLLIVLLGVALMLFLYFGNMGGGTSYMQQVATTRSQAKATVQDISTQQLSILIAQYRQEHGKLPSGVEDLDNDAAFRDPWGGALTFSFEESRGGATRVTYRSNGPDGAAGTEDDVVRTDSIPY